MCRIGYILAYLAAAGAAPPAVSPDPKSLVIPGTDRARSRVLVAKLGSPDFREREDAQGELAKMGRRALPALLDALETSRNPEIRARCHRLVPKAEAADLEARIQTFLADEKGKYEHDLPGWAEFCAAVGDAAGARGLFAEIVRDPGNRPLLAAIDRPPDELVRVVADHKQRLYTRLYSRSPARDAPAAPSRPSLSELAALYLADSLVEPGREQRNRLPMRKTAREVLTSSRVRNIVRTSIESEEPRDEAFRRVLAAWLATRTEPNELNSATLMVSSLGFVEGLVVAERAALADGLLSSRRGAAIAIQARVGGRERLASIRKLFHSNTVATSVQVNNDAYEIQLRDIALAMSILLTDQEPADYGFKTRSSSIRETARFSYSNYYFADAAARETAFEKWEAWVRAHKDKSGKK